MRFKRRIIRDPKKEAQVFALILGLLIIVFLVILRYLIARSQPPLNSMDTIEFQSVTFTLRMKKTVYQVGEDIVLSLNAQNTGNTPLSLSFNDLPEYDFIVQRELNLLFVRIPFEIWRYSAHRASLKKPHKIILVPSEKKEFTARWNQTDSSGIQVRPGKYRIIGTISPVGFQKIELHLRGKTEK